MCFRDPPKFVEVSLPLNHPLQGPNSKNKSVENLVRDPSMSIGVTHETVSNKYLQFPAQILRICCLLLIDKAKTKEKTYV